MELQQHIKWLSIQGFTVVKNVIDGEQVDDLLRKAVVAHNEDKEGVLNHIPELTSLVGDRTILDIIESLMGGDICVANGACVRRAMPNVNPPVYYRFHSDMTTEEFPVGIDRIPFWHSIAVLWALTPSTDQNGTVVVVPFSHHMDNDPRNLEVATYIHEVPVVMNPGDAMLMHGAVWHRRLPNLTDTARVLIHSLFLQRNLYDFDDGKTTSCCFGYWAKIEPEAHAKFPDRVKELTLLSTLPGRGGRE